MIDLEALMTLLRQHEAQPGDARIVEAQLVARLALNGPQTTEQLGAALGLTDSSISRTARRLMGTTRKGTRGADLICATRDPREGRRYVYQLQPRAQRLLAAKVEG